MDCKMLFLLVVSIAIINRAEVDSDDDRFAVIVCKEFQFSREALYNFVLLPKMTNRWINFIGTFIEADHKRIGVGKTYKALYDNGAADDGIALDSTVYKVTDFDKGNYIVVESNLSLRPRIEFYFSRGGSEFERSCRETIGKHREMSEMAIRLTFGCKSAIFQYTIGSMIRRILEEEMNRWLENLEGIFERMMLVQNQGLINNS